MSSDVATLQAENAALRAEVAYLREQLESQPASKRQKTATVADDAAALKKQMKKKYDELADEMMTQGKWGSITSDVMT